MLRGKKLEDLKVITPLTLNGVTSEMKSLRELSLKELENRRKGARNVGYRIMLLMQTKEVAHLFVILFCCCKDGLASLTATEMTSVSPLPPITSQQGLLQAVLNVTEKLRESSTRDLSVPSSTSMHGS